MAGLKLGTTYTNEVTGSFFNPTSHSVSETTVGLMKFRIKGELEVRYEASRSRSEHLTFTLHADVQSVLSEPIESEEVETISLPGLNVGEPMFATAVLTADSISDGKTVSIGDEVYT